MNSKLLQILDGPRVSSPTRRVLRNRLEQDRRGIALAPETNAPATVPFQPKTMTSAAFAVLQQVIARLLLEDVHQDASDAAASQPSSSIAVQLDESRATGKGNGWRYGTLPPDAQALAQGLEWIEKTAVLHHGMSFVQVSTNQQEDLLAGIQQGRITWPGFDAARWFEELLADATELYISNPERMVQLGIDAFADDPDGWSEVGLNNAQGWEPVSPLKATGTDGPSS